MRTNLPRHGRAARVTATVAGSRFPDTAANSQGDSGPSVSETEEREKSGREEEGRGGVVVVRDRSRCLGDGRDDALCT